MAEYIKREAAYEDFEKCNSENPKWTPSRVKALIARQKAADVAPVRHGRWDGDTCTSCNLPWNYNMTQNAQDWGYFDPMLDYCPNCGATMDGGDGNGGADSED